MDTAPSKFLFIFLLSILFVCSSWSLFSGLKDFVQKELKTVNQQILSSYRRELVQHDFMNPPITTFPTTTVTNPVTTPTTTVTNPVTTPSTTVTNPVTTPTNIIPTPPDTSTPPIDTIPPANPITTTPINPPPVPVTIPGVQPGVTNPVTTYPSPATTSGVPITNPVVAPPVISNAPAVTGQSWCVAKSGSQDNVIQTALDYACGIGGADCSAIQQGGSCYNPNSLQSVASYAFNSYFQRNPVQTSCDFGGTATVTNVNPSYGSCIFPTSSSSSGSPTSTSPTTTTPTTTSSSGATPVSSGNPPMVLNASNPAGGDGITGTGYGESPLTPTATTSSVSTSTSLQPFISCIILVIISRIVFGI